MCHTLHFFLCHCSTVRLYLCILIPYVSVYCNNIYIFVFAQLPMQSVPIITDVSTNLDQGEVYNIM